MATDRTTGGWYRTAIWTAVVSGVFTAVVAGLLVHNYWTIGWGDPLDSPELARMRDQLLEDPKNEDLKEAYRERDLELRRQYFLGQAFSQSGVYLLFGGFVVFLVAVRYAVYSRRTDPVPKGERETAEEQAREAARGRWAVVLLALAIAGIGVAWAALPPGGLWASLTAGDAVDDPDGGGNGGENDASGAGGKADVGPPPSLDELRRNWPRFRGPDGLGIAYAKAVPATWDGEAGQGVLWKTEVPLSGHSSPVVWGERVFLTGATAQERVLYAFDVDTGAIGWQASVATPDSDRPEPPDPLEDTGFAAPTVATDGRYVAAVFANGDVACLTCDGRPVWAKGLGVPENMYGHAASVAIWQDVLLVPLDQAAAGDGMSSLVALDLATGREVWRTGRPVGASWSTPILARTEGGPQVVAAGDPFVAAYDPDSGEALWRAKVLSGDVAASPVFAGGRVYAATAYEKLSAIRPDGRGDVTGTHVVWQAEGEMPDTVSPLADGKRVWVFTTDGLLTCFDATTGDELYMQEFDAVFKGSPTLAGGQVYVVTADGVAVRFAPADEYEELGRAPLGERSTCSPAFVDGRIYIRGVRHLFAIGSKDS